MEICSRFTGMERKDGAFLLHTDNADIKVCFVTDEIVRVRASFDHELAEESYVLMTTAWEDRMDALFKGERTRVEPFAAQVTEDDSTLTFATGKVTLVVDKDPINFKLLAADGSELYSTLPGNPFVKDANNRVVAYSRMKEDDCFYGFGEKTGLLDKNKTFQRERATDAMGYDAEKMDTLYKHIPFYIRLDRDTHKAVGVFYHNFYESVFNMGCEKSNYWPRYTYFQADGGDLDCFLIGGDTIARIVDNYTLLTGRPALLPKRALGYQGSSMYYPELEKDSDDAVLGFIDTIKEEGFPIDGFHLSSGYTSQNTKRCVFTWNTDRFKDPSGYFHAMNEKHAQNVPNVKPGVLLCNPRFDEFNADDVFVKDSKNPETYGVGKWHRLFFTRIDDLHSQIICSGKDHRSRKCKEPVCLRRFFADILTSEHLNRTKFIYRHKHADHNKQKDRKKQTDCHKDRLHFYMNSESGRPVKKLNCQKFRKF